MRVSRTFGLLLVTCLLYGCLAASLRIEELQKDKPLHYDVLNLNDVPANTAAGLYKVGPGQFKIYNKTEEPSVMPCVSIDYNRNKQTTGWERLSLKMHGNCEPKEEYWGAGFLELIQNWKTFKHSFHNVQYALKDEIDNWDEYWKEISNVEQNVRKGIAEHELAGNSGNFSLMDLVALYQAQIDGMYYGFNLAKAKSENPITVPMIYFINFGATVSEMKDIYDFTSSKKDAKAHSKHHFHRGIKNLQDFEADFLTIQDLNITDADFNTSDVTPVNHGHCNVFVKFLKDSNGNFDNFLFSHTTYDYYQNTLKIIKSVEVNHTNFKSRVLFPSYPGVVWSGDDLYITDRGLLVTETTLETEDTKAYKYVQGVKAKYPDFMRLFASIQLANTGAELVQMMKDTNTGSYTSQWMILDMKTFNQSKGTKVLANGTFYVVEQSTRRVLGVDMSPYFSNNTMEFWASFNIPYFKQIRQDLDAKTPAVSPDSLVPEADYAENHKYKIFQKYNPATNTVADLQYLMRLNRHGKNQKINSGDEVASREDLLKPSDRDYFGATDVKVLDYSLAQRGSFIAQLGPTWQNITPFVWPKKVYEKLRELPLKYVYPWVEYNWKVNQPVQIIPTPRTSMNIYY